MKIRNQLKKVKHAFQPHSEKTDCRRKQRKTQSKTEQVFIK